ncbi:hypothetical protein [Streptomyces sp. NPDC055912]|uniref:hypothetical protein n=1 Tax=Streptomyces sp. NPDC055912 TaxID=3345660 RepID=UPI0035DE4A25
MSELESRQAQFDGLGRALAESFNAENVEGGGWTHETERAAYGKLKLLHPSGLGIGLWQRYAYRKGEAGKRLTVEGVFPHGYAGLRPEGITVGLHRPPALMAKDIVRRFLPGYLAKIGEALAAAADAEREEQARIAMNRRIARVLPNISHGPVSPHEASGRRTTYWSGGLDSLAPLPAIASGQVTLNHNAQTMDVKLSNVPAGLALQILALLDPHRVLEGTIAPREVGPARRELGPAVRTIPGEVVATTTPVAGGPAELVTAPPQLGRLSAALCGEVTRPFGAYNLP